MGGRERERGKEGVSEGRKEAGRQEGSLGLWEVLPCTLQEISNPLSPLPRRDRHCSHVSASVEVTRTKPTSASS